MKLRLEITMDNAAFGDESDRDRDLRAYIATREEAEKFLAARLETDKATPCCYGHHDCSSYKGGPCLDETLGNFPELDPGNDDANETENLEVLRDSRFEENYGPRD